jgi:hypothetical protein
MLRIMSNFKDELYGANMCYQPDGSVGPKPDPSKHNTNRTTENNATTSNRKTSMSSLGRKAMDADELRILQE